MTVKCTGAEFKAFYNDKKYWIQGDPNRSADTYHDDHVITIDGKEDEECDLNQIPDNVVVAITGGVVFGRVVGASEPSLESYFRRWKKEQSTVTLLVSCEKAVLDTVMAAIKAAGGKVAS